MNEDNADNAASESTDSINNVKAEFTRKMGNIDQKLADMQKLNEQLLASLSTISQPKPPQRTSESANKELEDLYYKDPVAYADAIEARALAKVRKEQSDVIAASQRQQAAVNALVAEFPELTQADNEFKSRAIEIYNSMSDDEKSSPAAYKSAVYTAAAELGMKPKSKRTDDDNFQFGSSGSKGATKPPRRREDEIDERTIEFAELIGRPVHDKEYRERLKKAGSRKNWNKYR